MLEAPSAAPAISAKGLGPQRPAHLEYTAPSVDGEAGVVHASEDVDEVVEVGPDATRAERRRAERAARKRAGGKK
jgi:preprotein translocase subunit SecA